jgi:hypothetical protein
LSLFLEDEAQMILPTSGGLQKTKMTPSENKNDTFRKQK